MVSIHDCGFNYVPTFRLDFKPNICKCLPNLIEITNDIYTRQQDISVGHILTHISTMEEIKNLIPLLLKDEKENMNISNKIKKVIFNNPATIIIWEDGSKTVVKAHNEPYDKEKGFAMAVVKYVFGNKPAFNDIINKYIKESEN